MIGPLVATAICLALVAVCWRDTDRPSLVMVGLLDLLLWASFLGGEVLRTLALCAAVAVAGAIASDLTSRAISARVHPLERVDLPPAVRNVRTYRGGA